MCLKDFFSRSTFSLAILGLLAVLPAQGQAPAYLVRDINVDHPAGFPDQLGVLESEGAGSFFYFVINDEIHGREVWRSDGTPAGTFLLKDARPGANPSYPFSLTRSNGLLFFTAHTSGPGPSAGSSALGRVLWKSDGTPEGTSPLKSDSFPYNSEVPMIDAGGKLLFIAQSPDSVLELWGTDGTEAGTYPVGDAARGFLSVPRFLAAGNGLVLFAADNGSGMEPWVTDGTNAGTYQIADLNPVSGSILPNPGRGQDAVAAPWGGFVFVANSVIWWTDGTAAGTHQLGTSSYGNYPYGLTAVNGKVVFTAGGQVWATDGSAAGTLLLRDVWPDTYSYPNAITAVGNQAFFYAWDDIHGNELWATDGTPAGTRLVKDLVPGTANSFSCCVQYLFTSFGGRLIFYSPAAGATFWTSDGTEAGTQPFTPSSGPWPNMDVSGPDNYAMVDGRLFFRGDFDRSIWVTDGTPAGSYRVLDIPHQTSAFYVVFDFLNGVYLPRDGIADAGGTLLFHATDTFTDYGELWRSDGTTDGTWQVKNLAEPSGDPSVVIRDFHAVDDRLVFSTTGGMLWLSDGTTAGTLAVPGLFSVWDSMTKPLNHQLFFFAIPGNASQGLWATDGTEEGTVPVVASWNGSDLTVSGEKIFYLHFDTDIDLWVTDGTGPGTAIGHVPGPENLTGAGGTLFFSSWQGDHHTLWKSDGTAAGTIQVKDVSIIPPREGEPFASLPDGIVFFLANDGTHGQELWRSDGTSVGTVLVKDIRPGLSNTQIYGVTTAGNRAFFVADDGIHGLELWVSDGTEAGTHLVRDIVPGAGSSFPYQLAAAGSTLVFTAFDPVYGVEAWRSDGTAVGTRRLADIAPGPLSSSPLDYVLSGSNLFFVANDNTTGFELWAIPKTSALAAFGDVPTDYWSWRFIEALAASGVTGGCADGQFCPGDRVNRAQMAVFILAARDSVPPPPATGTLFTDVPPGYWAGPWIEELAREGVTGGCSTAPPRYCPDHDMTRAEMAVLLTAARHETPPPATGTRFADVPADYWAAPWIEQLAADGITAGCGGGNYCPDQPITRGEMAVFLATAFHLPMP